MTAHVFDSPEDTARAVADQITNAIALDPCLVLGLAAGRTPLPVYGELRRRCAAGTVDFSSVRTFNLDEFVGVYAASPGSFRRFMKEQLFDGINLPETHIGFLDGMAPDPEAECRRYEEEIGQAGGINLQILGIGTNGHIGFNEPADQLIADTHRAALQPSTRRSNAALFSDDPARVPAFALTMGMRTICSAGRVILMATGERKAPCIEQLVRGPLTTHLPASLLQLHPRVELYLDRLAASRLA